MTSDEIESVLRQDIEWAVSNRNWDPNSPAVFDYEHGKWAKPPLASLCGVCAVGAYVLRRNLPVVPHKNNIYLSCVDTAAADLGVSVGWMQDLFHAVADHPHDDRPLTKDHYDNQDARDMGWRLRDFADSIDKPRDTE
jgi:hypothetical protein